MNYKHVGFFVVLFQLAIHGQGAFAQTGVTLRPKVYLQGALHGLLPSATLMRDDLRKQGLIPLTEPYTGLANFQHKGGGGGETIDDPTVLQVTGPNAIVDWVVVELRSNPTATTILATRSALVQRDGDVVAPDGISPVSFPTVASGQYHIAIRHRSHLGILTTEKYLLEQAPKTIDLTSLNADVCTNGRVPIGEKVAIWGGDSNRDGRVIYQGPGNDRSVILLKSTLSEFPDNVLLSANFIGKGYSIYDLNMDGKVIFQGPNNEVSMLFQNIMMGQEGYFNPPLTNFILHDCLSN